jgi:hypothetical protein
MVTEGGKYEKPRTKAFDACTSGHYDAGFSFLQSGELD